MGTSFPSWTLTKFFFTHRTISRLWNSGVPPSIRTQGATPALANSSKRFLDKPVHLEASSTEPNFGNVAQESMVQMTVLNLSSDATMQEITRSSIKSQSNLLLAEILGDVISGIAIAARNCPGIDECHLPITPANVGRWSGGLAGGCGITGS